MASGTGRLRAVETGRRLFRVDRQLLMKTVLGPSFLLSVAAIGIISVTPTSIRTTTTSS